MLMFLLVAAFLIIVFLVLLLLVLVEENRRTQKHLDITRSDLTTMTRERDAWRQYAKRTSLVDGGEVSPEFERHVDEAVALISDRSLRLVHGGA